MAISDTSNWILALGTSVAVMTGAAFAQENAGQTAEATTEGATEQATDSATQGGFTTGQPVIKPGETYIASEFTDWQMRCVKTEIDADPCQLYQLLKDEQGNSVAEISLFGLPDAKQGGAVAGATIITPLETLLTEQLTLSVDGGTAKRYPYRMCAQIGCFVRFGLTDAEISQFKRGNAAVVQIVPVAAPDAKVKLSVSLSGFTAGYDAVNAHNLEADAKARAAREAAQANGEGATTTEGTDNN